MSIKHTGQQTPVSGIDSSPLDCTGDTQHRFSESYGFVPGPGRALVTRFLHLVIGKQPCSWFWDELWFLHMRSPFDSPIVT
jgi:hypothetical protein